MQYASTPCGGSGYIHDCHVFPTIAIQ